MSADQTLECRPTAITKEHGMFVVRYSETRLSAGVYTTITWETVFKTAQDAADFVYDRNMQPANWNIVP